MSDKKSDSKTKGKQPEINDKVKVEFEPSIRDILTSMDEGFENLVNDSGSTLIEVLSVAARIKKKQQIRRYRAKIQIGRRRAMRRRATNAVIQRRARRGAVSSVKRKLSGGRSPGSMTYAERARVEKLVARRKSMVTRRARRLVITKRQQDRSRKLGGR